MRSLNNFIVEIESPLQDKIKTDSGIELYVDTRFNEFEYRTTEGEVLSTPAKYETGAEVGDMLYFHHHVVINGGSPLVKEDNQYVVQYDHEHASANQAIAYTSKRTGELRVFKGWSLLEPVEEDDQGSDELIKIIKLEEPAVTQGVVSVASEELSDLGIEVGDIVGFKKNRDYRIKIDGKEYYRVAVSELLYKV